MNKRRIRVRRDTSTNWLSANPVLEKGEYAYESNTGRTKIGDGSNQYSLLSYTTKLSPLPLAMHTVLSVPSASDNEGSIIYVSDETGGATLSFSDGVNWRRVQDREIIS